MLLSIGHSNLWDSPWDSPWDLAGYARAMHMHMGPAYRLGGLTDPGKAQKSDIFTPPVDKMSTRLGV
jgi:hypothetical protein